MSSHGEASQGNDDQPCDTNNEPSGEDDTQTGAAAEAKPALEASKEATEAEAEEPKEGEVGSQPKPQDGDASKDVSEGTQPVAKAAAPKAPPCVPNAQQD